MIGKTRRTIGALIAIAVFLSSASGQEARMSEKVGILVMAHGGDVDWNAAIVDAVAPLRDYTPVVVAFGMADRDSLQAAVAQLETESVTRIAIVRLFISAEAFRHQTEYLFGLRGDPPKEFIQHESHSGGNPHAGHAVNSAIPPPIRKKAAIILSQRGLCDSPRIGEILAERALALSVSPETESVLILAHGYGDDGENSLLLSKMEGLANKVRDLRIFRTVQAGALREDWKEKRAEAEKQIREFVEHGNQDTGRVLVVPFRVFGFGPYRDVLKGLQYVADGRGFLPHPKVTEWIKREAMDCFMRAGRTLSSEDNNDSTIELRSQKC